MNSPIQEILTAFSMAYKEKGQKVIALVAMYLADGYSVPDAVDKAMQTAAVSSFFTEAVHTVIQKAVSAGAGSDIPLLSELTGAWDASGMTLSAKLHGAETEMRQVIISTIQAQQRLGASATRVARALYDGYNSGHIIRRQSLPQYLNTITVFARRSDLTDQDRTALQRLIRRARRQTEIMSADGVPNKSLQTAYRQLLDAVETNDTVAMENAVRTAVEEKSRYVAERIARTESARAWADGFHARYDTDDDVAAYKWTLSSRHPHYDICDMYAQADLWGLGPGVFPKDKTPILPVHPHCLCHLSLVYVTEIDKSKQCNQIRNGGDVYLKRQSHQKRCYLLGIDGARAWEKGRADWRQYMRNWSSITAKSRLLENTADDIIKSEISIGQQLMYKDKGKDAFIPEHTMVIPKKVIAGLGSGSKLRIADKLAQTYGGMAQEWQKVVGVIISDKYLFDIHWYHHKDMGDILFKIKSYTERRE